VARAYPRGDIGRWARPCRPSQIDVRRWRAFCGDIEQRIAAVRATEGMGGADAWCTFDPPLPARRPISPPVRLRLAPIPTGPRDPATGRLQRSA
jgi:hypothetical protein